MLEFLFEILGEFLLQAFGEALLEIGLHSLSEPFRRAPNPWLAAVGYTLFGAALGGLSLLLFPIYLMPPPWRMANLFLTPFAVGGLMVLMGHWRARRGDAVLRINRFVYGFLFAAALAVVRYVFAG
jgi:hypothetical protein